jgi:hypothetical protein
LKKPILKTLAEDCEPKIIVMRTSEACPRLALGSLWNFFNDFYIFFGIFMIVLGGYLISFGAKFENYTLFLIGTCTVSTLFMIVIYAGFFPDKSEAWVVFLTLLISLGIGSAAGYAAMKFAKYGVILGGAWLGGIIGSVFYSVALRTLSESYPLAVMWLSIISLAGLVAYLAHRYFGVAMIFGTAIIGSFLIFRVSFLV